jgi:polar amino acid transport system ATP-binding protein
MLRDLGASTDITFLCVTHEMGFARDFSDRVLMFDAGQVIEDAPPIELFSTPRHQRTKDFLHAVVDRA